MHAILLTLPASAFQLSFCYLHQMPASYRNADSIHTGSNTISFSVVTAQLSRVSCMPRDKVLHIPRKQECMCACSGRRFEGGMYPSNNGRDSEEAWLTPQQYLSWSVVSLCPDFSPQRPDLLQVKPLRAASAASERTQFKLGSH